MSKVITFKVKGSFNKTEQFFKRAKAMDIESILKRYGEKGVKALSDATPVRTGATAGSWYYEIEKTKNGYAVTWLNSNTNNGTNIAIIIQYGHGTGFGGYVRGIDYINPAMRPLFEELAEEAWREVVG